MAHSGQRDRVFISYSHRDAEWLDKVRAVLDPDIRSGRIQYFDDRELQPGDPWFQEITEAIDHARVAVLLVSPNFFASRFIAEDELPRILEAADDGLTVLWVPLSGQFYGPEAIPGSEKLAARQAVWDASQTLASLPEESRVGRLLDLCRRINAHMTTRVPCNLPFGSLGDLFKGREDELRKLDEQFSTRGASVILQPSAISGLGGIGKTRLAIEYAHRRRDRFTAILFVSANTPADLEANVARLCADDKALDLPEFRRAQQAEQYSAVVRWLNQNAGWLLILDNVDTEDALEAVQGLIGSLRGGHVLITSRLTGWGGSIRTLSLGVIPLDDAVELLLRKANAGGRHPRSDDLEKARALAVELGCLPLALTHAGAYVRWGDKSFDRYLNEFDKALAFHKKGMIEYDPDPHTDRAAKTVATTYFLSINLLGPAEKSLLRAASVLAPAPIPIAMFAGHPDEFRALVELWRDESGGEDTEQDAEDALSELANYSLVERGDGDFSIHRMERLVLRRQIPNESLPKWVEAVRAALERHAPEEIAESPRTWPEWDKLRPHAEALIDAQSHDERISPSSALLISMANLYYGKGLYRESLAQEVEAVRLVERTKGPDSAELAARLLAYGESLRSLGRREEAESAFRRSLELKKKIYGPDDIEVAEGMNYLAIVTEDSDSVLLAAKQIYEAKFKNLESAEMSRSQKDGLGKILGNLSVRLLAKEKLDEAELYAAKAYGLWESTWGPGHQRTLGAMALRADILSARGELEQAEVLYRNALETSGRVLGREHPDTLSIALSLVGLLTKAGRDEEASQMQIEILEQRCLRARVIPDVQLGRDINNLACDYRKLGRFEKAEPLARKALEVDREQLGPDDPIIPHRLNNLASILLLGGKTPEALERLAEAWAFKAGKADITASRILFTRLAAALLEGESPDVYIGQLKTMLAADTLTENSNVARVWDAGYFITYIRGQVPEEDEQFLATLIPAMNDRANLPALEAFPRWASQLPVPLDAPWPAATKAVSQSS